MYEQDKDTIGHHSTLFALIIFITESETGKIVERLLYIFLREDEMNLFIFNNDAFLLVFIFIFFYEYFGNTSMMNNNIISNYLLK